MSYMIANDGCRGLEVMNKLAEMCSCHMLIRAPSDQGQAGVGCARKKMASFIIILVLHLPPHQTRTSSHCLIALLND